MENAPEILVVILSSFLALFLLLGIVLLVLIIKVVLVVRRVTSKAEELADKAEAFGDFVQHATTPIVIAKLFSSFSDKIFTRPGKSKRK